MPRRPAGWLACLAVLLLVASPLAFAQEGLPATLSAKIDGIAADALAASGVPSASIAVVRDGKLATNGINVLTVRLELVEG